MIGPVALEVRPVTYFGTLSFREHTKASKVLLYQPLCLPLTCQYQP